MKGCDYSWDHPDFGCLRSQGVGFIVRYGSRDPSKNLTQSELDSALAAGFSVAVVWQEGKTQMTRGYSGGQQDARDADEFINSLGLPGIPVYYSCDFDPQSSDWAAIDAYLEGTISVTGLDRNGGYGGKAFITREFDRDKLTYGWQTYAWSGSPTQWDTRAQLRQVNNDISVCGGTIDWDESHSEDFGQWPRPYQEVFMSSSVAYKANGQPVYACVWTDGKINVKFGDGGAWTAVDANQGAVRSGASISRRPDDGLVIVFTNSSGDVCAYEQGPGGGAWTWKNLKGDAK